MPWRGCGGGRDRIVPDSAARATWLTHRREPDLSQDRSTSLRQQKIPRRDLTRCGSAPAKKKKNVIVTPYSDVRQERVGDSNDAERRISLQQTGVRIDSSSVTIDLRHRPSDSRYACPPAIGSRLAATDQWSRARDRSLAPFAGMARLDAVEHFEGVVATGIIHRASTCRFSLPDGKALRRKFSLSSVRDQARATHARTGCGRNGTASPARPMEAGAPRMPHVGGGRRDRMVRPPRCARAAIRRVRASAKSAHPRFLPESVDDRRKGMPHAAG